MTRKKVKLAYIANDSARKATYKKRKKGLMKKVSELSTLCDIDACAIVYSPYDSQPEVWPSTVGAQRVLTQFKRMPAMEQSKKMVNQESFLRQRITKASEQLKKQRKENREKEMVHVMFQCLTGQSVLSLNILDLNDMGWLVEQKVKEVNRALESINKKTDNNNNNNNTAARMATLHPATATATPPPTTTTSRVTPAPPRVADHNGDLGQILIDQKPEILGFGMNMQGHPWSINDSMNSHQDQMGSGTWFPRHDHGTQMENPHNSFWSNNGFFP